VKRDGNATSVTFGRISISFIAAQAPLDEMPRKLNTTSLPTQRAATTSGKSAEHGSKQSRPSLQLREAKAWFSVGKEQIYSLLD
jgi:hypothetical protein